MSFKPIDLGVLNRLSASVTFDASPELTITSESLAKPAINLAPQGDATHFIEVLTGVVPSPEPYQLVNFRIHMVKTLSICALYQARLRLNTLLGNATVRPDVNVGGSGLQPFDIYNVALMNFAEMEFNGQDAAFVAICQGSWNINTLLWN